MTGGKRKRSRRSKKRGGAACESGEACAAQFSADSSLSQGESFLKMNQAYHGGKRTRGRRMRGGAADMATAFEAIPAEIHEKAGTAVLDQAIADLSKFAPPSTAHQSGGKRKSRRNKRSQRGGSAMLGEAFNTASPDMAEKAGTSVLDTAFAQLSKFLPMKGGKRTRRRISRKAPNGGAMGSSPIDAPSMLLRPEDYKAAFLSPQWEQENLVNPNFKGPEFVYGAPATKGGARRKTRRVSRKTRKTRKAAKKCPRGKVYRKTFIRKGRRIMGKCVRK